jgi:hypothetical protein
MYQFPQEMLFENANQKLSLLRIGYVHRIFPPFVSNAYAAAMRLPLSCDEVYSSILFPLSRDWHPSVRGSIPIAGGALSEPRARASRIAQRQEDLWFRKGDCRIDEAEADFSIHLFRQPQNFSLPAWNICGEYHRDRLYTTPAKSSYPLQHVRFKCLCTPARRPHRFGRLTWSWVKKGDFDKAGLAILPSRSMASVQSAEIFEDPSGHLAYIALGSNIGDRIAWLESACKEMRASGIEVLRTSSLYETKAMYVEDQDPFINGVCEVSIRHHRILASEG